MTQSTTNRRPAVMFCCGLLASIFAFEGYARLVEATPLWRILPLPEVSLFAPDKFTGYAHRPGANGIWTTENRTRVQINALGLRDKLDRTLAKPAGATRWAVIGDSIVESLQVPLDQTFPVFAEKALSNAGNHPVEIVNLGLSGATPAVIAERLRTRAKTLDIDGAIVMISAIDLWREQPDDDARFAGYVPAPNGGATLSHAFRNSSGYKFRVGPLGSAFYWMLDNSRVALALNNRKNHGLFKELSAGQARAPRATQTANNPYCTGAQRAKHLALWAGRSDGFAQARLSAFLSAVRDSAEHGQFQVVFAIRNIPRCPKQPRHIEALRAAMAARLTTHGFSFVDVRGELESQTGATQNPSDLYGYGARIGHGHLNTQGHTHYARLIQKIIGNPEPDR